MKCPLCGKEHSSKEECRLSELKSSETALQHFQPAIFPSLFPEPPEIDLPQFEGPKFDLPQTGPLDIDEEFYHLPRYKPPIFDLLKSKPPNSENDQDESNSRT